MDPGNLVLCSSSLSDHNRKGSLLILNIPLPGYVYPEWYVADQDFTTLMFINEFESASDIGTC